MASLELKGCGVLSEASINCPLLTSFDASFCRLLTFSHLSHVHLCFTSFSLISLLICSQLKDDCLSATTSSCPLIESLVLMSCPSVGSDGLLSLHSLQNLTYLDLSYTFLDTLQPVYESCLWLKVNFYHLSILLLSPLQWQVGWTWFNILYFVAKSMPIYPVWTCTLLDTWATFLYIFFLSKKTGWLKFVLVKLPNYYKVTHVKMGWALGHNPATLISPFPFPISVLLPSYLLQ